MIVDSIMARDVATVARETGVREAARRMMARRIGCLVVVAGGAPVGIVTERDLSTRVLAAGRDPDRTTVADVMSSPLATVEPAVQVDEAAATMRRLGVKRLVVTLGGELRGIVTVTDLAYARPELTRRFMESWVKPRWDD